MKFSTILATLTTFAAFVHVSSALLGSCHEGGCMGSFALTIFAFSVDISLASIGDCNTDECVRKCQKNGFKTGVCIDRLPVFNVECECKN
uniref:Defensin-like protein n=1 Tax=Parastrongyloides trichosuri TaxID=131310 RepID=A0A0N4Z6B0_PARTI